MTQDTSTPTFEALGLHPILLKALTQAGYSTPTPIQAQSIPHALQGRDLLLSAQTGSGKTASFVLPILDKLAKTVKKPISTDDFSQKSHRKHTKTAIKALILTPTRELAMQVQDNVRKYSSQMRGVFSVPLVGGAPYGGQIRALHKGVQIVIATPGRLIDHMNDGRVDLSELEVLVLDEADRMLDMGFSDAIDTILTNVPATRQTIMSSATWDGAVGKIAESFTVNPERISIKVESAHIEESVYFCDDFHHKNKILVDLLNQSDIKQAIIFTATKRSTEQLSETLIAQGLSARYLHGDLPQGKRNRIISDVKSGKCNFLIATDVAARGIDISTISHVVNYDLPRQVEDYVHRIGRCGRAGRTGVAMNLCSRDDRRQLTHINRYLGRDMKEAVVVGLEPKFSPKKTQDKAKRRSTSRFDGGERAGRVDGRATHRFGRQGMSYDADDRLKVVGKIKVRADGGYELDHEERPQKSNQKHLKAQDARPNKRREVADLHREYAQKYPKARTKKHTHPFYDRPSDDGEGQRFERAKKHDRSRKTKQPTAPSSVTHRPKKRSVEEVLFHHHAPKRDRRFGRFDE